MNLAPSTTRMTASTLWSQELQASKPLDRATEIECARTNDRDRLVTANLRLAASIANRYRRSGADMEDLIQAANMGLIRAAKTFDPDAFGTKFSTYATNWIINYCQRFLDNHGRPIRIPVHHKPMLAALARGLANDVDELHALFPGTTKRNLADLVRAYRANPTSIEASLDAEGVSPIQVTYEDAEDPERAAERQEAQDLVRAALATLPERERAILERRHLDGEEGLAEIARTLDLSRERVRQLEGDALSKLRRAVAALGRVTPELRSERLAEVAERRDLTREPPALPRTTRAQIEQQRRMTMPSAKHTDDEKKAAVARLDAGESGITIAKEIGISSSLLYLWRKKLKDGKPKAAAKKSTKADRVNDLLGDARPERKSKQLRDLAVADEVAPETEAPTGDAEQLAIDLIESLRLPYSLGLVVHSIVAGDLDRAAAALDRARSRRAA